MITRARICPEHQSRRSSVGEQRNPTPQARSLNLRVEPSTQNCSGGAVSRLLIALCLHGAWDRALNSPPRGSGIDECASVFQTDQAGSIPAAPPFRPLRLRWVRMRLFQSCEAGSSPAGGTTGYRGAGLTDPPLKRRSAPKCGARSNRAPGAAAVRWCTAVAHNERAPGSSPGAATIYAGPADRVIWAALWTPSARFESAVSYTGVM